LGQRLFDFPAPVTMLLIAVVLKLARAVPPNLQQGAFVVYRFFSVAVTYPLLFAIGVSLTPWDKLVAAFTPSYIVTAVTTARSIGYILRRKALAKPAVISVNPVATTCHSGQGGTGDVAILTAANRMSLMPFASIATRIGGAITVTITLIVLSRLV
jgi:malate:Na+ symporter